MAVQDLSCNSAALSASAKACPSAPIIEKDVCGKAGCDTVSCLTRTTTFAQSVSGCIATVVYTDITGAVVAIDGATSCPQLVQISNPPKVAVAAPPVAVQSTSCDLDVSVQAANALSQAVHTTPGTALLVKLCTSSAKDSELVILCKVNGDKVALQYDITLTPPALLSQFNLNTNTADVTPISALSNCGIEKLDYGSAVDYCVSGVAYTRIDVFDAAAQFVVGSIWQNDQGLQVAPPASAVKGSCSGTKFEEVVHWLDAGVCVSGLALYTRNQNNIVTLNGVVSANGIPLTPTSTIAEGECPEFCAPILIPFIATSWAMLR